MDFDQFFRSAFGYSDQFQEMRKMMDDMDKIFGTSDTDSVIFVSPLFDQSGDSHDDSENINSHFNRMNITSDEHDDGEFHANGIRDALLKPPEQEEFRDQRAIQHPIINDQSTNFNDCTKLRRLFLKPGDEDFGQTESRAIKDMSCNDCEKNDATNNNNFMNFNRMHQDNPQMSINFKSVIRHTKFDSAGNKISSTETREGDNVTLIKEVINSNGDRTVTTQTYNDRVESPQLDTNFDKRVILSNPHEHIFRDQFSSDEEKGFISSMFKSFWKLFE